MLLPEDAHGATPEELDKMNDEVMDMMTTAYHCENLAAARVWAEDMVLSRHGYR